ncbi:MAG: hypothetical protein ACT4O5_11915 [Gammaproteobacteria bacterium]
MDNAALHDLVQQLLAKGQLPNEAATRLVAAYGEDTPCAVCNAPMRASDVVYEVSFRSGDTQPLVMHYACFDSWDHVRREIISIGLASL